MIVYKFLLSVLISLIDQRVSNKPNLQIKMNNIHASESVKGSEINMNLD
jgi:hypothetical protein